MADFQVPVLARSGCSTKPIACHKTDIYSQWSSDWHQCPHWVDCANSPMAGLEQRNHYAIWQQWVRRVSSSKSGADSQTSKIFRIVSVRSGRTGDGHFTGKMKKTRCGLTWSMVHSSLKFILHKAEKTGTERFLHRTIPLKAIEQNYMGEFACQLY